jgi:uncharacterized membrane protein YdbT with pleckstrin-like domain
MTDDWWFRGDDERVVWRGQPRLSAALGGVAAGLVICGLAAAAALLVDLRLAAGVLLGVAVAAWALLRVRRTEYLLTTRALWAKRGVAGRTVRRIGIDKVQNTAFSRSATGSAFGYGTITVEVAGGDALRLRRIDDPESVQAAIADRTGGSDDGIPGSAAQWRSVLRVVREIRAAVE